MHMRDMTHSCNCHEQTWQHVLWYIYLIYIYTYMYQNTSSDIYRYQITNHQVCSWQTCIYQSTTSDIGGFYSDIYLRISWRKFEFTESCIRIHTHAPLLFHTDAYAQTPTRTHVKCCANAKKGEERIHTHTYIHFFTCTGTPTHTHISVCASMCGCKGWNIHANTQTYTLSHAREHPHTHISICVHQCANAKRGPRIYTYTHFLACTWTLTHTHINVCASIYVAGAKSCPNHSQSYNPHALM